jgi:uncharacterized protein involved in response to NO
MQIAKISNRRSGERRCGPRVQRRQMTPIPRLRRYGGPGILSHGFRPFFLFGAIYAGVAVLAWLPVYFGEIAVPSALAPRDWHVHEMLFGYVAAVVTGFLLTAIPNWTGRLPIQGTPLLVLFAMWLAGRVAIALSGQTGWLPAALADAVFLLLVAVVAAREIIAGRNWRNLMVVALVSVLALANIGFHVEAHFSGAADYSTRIGMGVVVVLVMLIGGRIIPSFTHNWLARERPGRLPAPFGRFDAVAIAASAAALVVWIGLPEGRVTAAGLALAAVLQAARLLRWAGERTLREPLLTVLHVGFAFVPLGYALLALAAAGSIPATAGIHAWTAGAFGVMTLAVMTRATLGHTGHELTASRATQFIYAAAILAAVSRICAALQPAWSEPLLHVAAVAWATAFLGMAAVYGPMLWRKRKPATEA